MEASRPVCAACQECPYFSLCRGGCRRWREPFVDGKPGLNQLCPAYRMFLHMRQSAWKGWAYIFGRNMWEVENRKILDINTY